MANKDRSNKKNDTKRTNTARGVGYTNDKNLAGVQRGDDYRSTNLRDSAMMAHLQDALENGEDIGEYGRLTFVIVARHFMSDDEMVKLLMKQPDVDETDIRARILQVKERDYNPPKRERILQWMEKQEFPICPNPEDPNGCNVYRDLQFPDNIYANIEDFWEERAEADQE